MSFFAELKRRNVFKVGVAYTIIAWLLIQITDIVAPAFRFPDWTLTFIIYFLIIGFPVALFLAWAFELTPEGIKPTQSVVPSESRTKITGQKLNYIIIGLMALAIVFLVLDNYVLVDQGSVNTVNQAEKQTPIEEKPAPAEEQPQPDLMPNSVAVLPFENMSPDENNVYFAAGLHEEILNRLAKLKNLNVIARTTMVQYAKTTKPLKQIASELNVQTVMEGSVRYAGDRVRVTTQLIDPAREVHLWSETYDYELKDIFSIESDVAMNVANALEAEFSPEEQAQIEAKSTASPEAYALYIEARGLEVRWTPNSITQAIERVDRALALDPDFAECWLLKGAIHANATIWIPEHAEEHRAESDRAIMRALAINPNLPEVYSYMQFTASTRGEWQRIEEIGRKAISRGVDESRLWRLYRFILGYLGEFRDSRRTATQRNPLDAVNSFLTISIYDTTGNADAALAEYERGKLIFENASYGPGHASALVTLMGMGDHDRVRELAASGIWKDSPVVTAAVAHFDAPEEALTKLHAVYAGTKKSALIQLQHLAIWAAWFGDQQMALDAMSDIYDASPPNVLWVWRPLFRDMRRAPGFKVLVKKFGFVDFWRKYGWPDLCKPVSEDDFECT